MSGCLRQSHFNAWKPGGLPRPWATAVVSSVIIAAIGYALIATPHTKATAPYCPSGPEGN